MTQAEAKMKFHWSANNDRETYKKNYTTKADWDQEKKLMPIYAEY